MRLTIEGLLYGGSGIARTDEGKVVFVPYTAPQDVCTVRVVEQRRDFIRAEPLSIDSPSPLRCEPPCHWFGSCGGCQLQHIGYEAQLKWKAIILKEALRRIASVDVEPGIIGALKPLHYRARATLHVSDGGRLGFFAPGSHRVVEVDHCVLLLPRLNEAIRRLQGSLPSGVHSVELMADVEGGGVVCSFYTDSRRCSLDEGALGWLKGFELRQKRPFGRGRGRLIKAWGERLCSYRVGGGLRLCYSPHVFFQVNPEMNALLVEHVLGACRGYGSVLDCFCGVGNFTLPLAAEGHTVAGFDINPEAIRLARRAARAEGLGAVELFCSDGTGGKVLERLASSVVVLDPPRGGCRPLSMRVAEAGVERVVYVSCNPTTLGRDLKEFLKRGYRVESTTLVDMFPQTYHIECITVLTL